MKSASRQFAAKYWWYLLLALPILAMLWVPSYNHVEPTWLGFPFFYWYQLLWIPLGAAILGLVYIVTRR